MPNSRYIPHQPAQNGKLKLLVYYSAGCCEMHQDSFKH